MLGRIIGLIKRQNSWYDGLDKTDSWLRFYLFLLPIVLALWIDFTLFILGIETTSIVFYCVLLTMAIWRFIGYR